MNRKQAWTLTAAAALMAFATDLGSRAHAADRAPKTHRSDGVLLAQGRPGGHHGQTGPRQGQGNQGQAAPTNANRMMMQQMMRRMMMRMMMGMHQGMMMGMMHGGGRGGGMMMGRGGMRMGQGMMRRMGAMGISPMMGRRLTTRKLDADEVRRVIDGRLAWQGNKRLKVGKVTEKDANTVIAEIQTVDGSLVTRLSVNRTNGSVSHAE